MAIEIDARSVKDLGNVRIRVTNKLTITSTPQESNLLFMEDGKTEPVLVLPKSASDNLADALALAKRVWVRQ